MNLTKTKARKVRTCRSFDLKPFNDFSLNLNQALTPYPGVTRPALALLADSVLCYSPLTRYAPGHTVLLGSFKAFLSRLK